MEGNISDISYETFKSALQTDANYNDPHQNVINSTMVSAGGSDSKTDVCRVANGNIIANGKRRIINFPLPYKCNDCGKEFRKIENLRVHFMKHLSGKTHPTTDQPPYKCRHKGCDIDFLNKHDRKNHERCHVASSNFNCERLQKMFKYK